MKNIFVYILLSSIAVSVSASNISGLVIDKETRLPIEFATVLTLDRDSSYISGCITDKKGNFRFDELSHDVKFLKISFVGYCDAIYNIDSIKANDVFYLHPTAQLLEEVVVSANAKPFTIRDDRIVFNPSFVTYAVNANDIIRQAPGVMDTGTSLVMPGKDAIKVFINGKEQKGSLSDILLLLKSYPANNVESVEVMTNPSARYSMGRNIGVIDVKLKRKQNDYMGANASYSISHDTRVSNEGAIGLLYQGKRLATTLNAAGNLKKYDLKERNNLFFSNYERYAVTDMLRNADDYVLRWNLNYQLGKNWNTGVSAYFFNGDMKQQTEQSYHYTYEDGSEDDKKIKGHRTDNSKTYFTSWDIDGKISESSKFMMSVDYFYKKSPTERTLNELQTEEIINYSFNDISNENLTVKANVNVVPDANFSFNLGIGGILTISENFENATYEAAVNTLDDFLYAEEELDLYGEAKYKFSKNWMLRGSLRYQSIWTETKSSLTKDYSRHFDVFCPSAYLSYSFGNNQSIQLGYYYNINKPTLTELNPAKLYMGNDTYRQGNPELNNSRHYVVNLTYSLGSFMLQPYIEWLDNGITEISRIEENRYQIMTWENAVDRRNIGMMIFWSYTKPKWMRVSFTAFVTNPVTTSDHLLLQSRASSFKFSINPNLQFYFDRKRKWILSVYGNYTGPEHTVDIKMEALWRLSTNLTWKPNGSFTLSAKGLNLLHSNTEGIQYIGESTMKFDNKYMYRGVQVSIGYTFGKSMRRTMERAVLRDMNIRTELD